MHTSTQSQKMHQQAHAQQSSHSGLPEHGINKINQVFAQHHNIQTVILYGSLAIGKFRNGSDIDLTMLGQSIDHTQLANITMQLDDLMLPYSFDLSLYHTIEHPALLAHIEQYGQVFYQAKQNI